MRRRPPKRQRGAALLIVMTAIAIVTAVTVDLAYNTRVSFQIAANARDDLRAYYLAKSGVNLSRLILHFQKQLDDTSSAVSAALKTQPAAAALVGGGVNFRLWEMLPIDSGSMVALLGGAAAPPPGAEGGEVEGGFGAFEGAFQARVEDEDRKINVRQLNAIGGRDAAQLLLLSQLFQDEKYGFLFEEEDANGTRVSREEMVVAMKDWVDDDEVSSALSPNPQRPFEPGFSDENYHYDRYDPRYKAKNAAFDTRDELYLIAGVGDAFMSAFGDRLTVYPDVNATINVNTNDPQQLMVNALVMAGGLQPALADPEFLPKLQVALRLARPVPFMSITPQQFATVLAALGVKVQPVYLQAQNTDSRGAFGDRSTTFRIGATGRVGEVERRIEAVVTLDKRAGPLAADLGRLLYWREE